jgi:hypothetical protein
MVVIVQILIPKIVPFLFSIPIGPDTVPSPLPSLKSELPSRILTLHTSTLTLEAANFYEMWYLPTGLDIDIYVWFV